MSAMTPEEARVRVPGILCRTEENPFVPLHKSGKSWLAVIAGGFVTFGNALNNAGQAFFSLGSVAGAPIGGGAAIGTFAAMTKLYGDSVFPYFQKRLTDKSQQEEHMALMVDLGIATELGLHRDRDKLQAFLRRSFEQRQAAIARKRFRQDLAKKADQLGEGTHHRLNIMSRLRRSARHHADDLGESFLAVLSNYFAEKSTDPALRKEMTDFFEGIYQSPRSSSPISNLKSSLSIMRSPALVPSVVSAPAGDGKKAEVKSLFDIEVKTLDQLKAAKENAGDKNHITLDLESAFTAVSAYQQWLWTKRRRGEELDQPLSRFERWFWKFWYGVEVKTEKGKRRAALKKALKPTNILCDVIVLSSETKVLDMASDEIERDTAEAQQLVGGTAQETDRLHARLKYYRYKMAEHAYNLSFKAFWEKFFATLGQVIGFLGAVGNAALGYLGLMALIYALGLSAWPAVWITLLVLGMITGFFSSFLMTRLRIVERLEDFGRWLDKNLPIENRWLRYTVVLLGALGSAAPAYFAFYAGQMLMAGFGASPALVLIFALICGVATFFGAGALMVESLYERIEPFVLISQASFYKSRGERFRAMLRLFFLGQVKPKAINFEDALKILIARSLGLLLLVGAIASQISLGVAPWVIAGTVFAVIGMFAMYSGVFEVAEKVVETVFSTVKWCIADPTGALKLGLLTATSAALLELTIATAGAWASHATFLGITATMASSLFCLALLTFVAAAAIMVYQYRVEIAMVRMKSLKEADKLLVASLPSKSGVPAILVKGLPAGSAAVPLSPLDSGPGIGPLVRSRSMSLPQGRLSGHGKC